MVETTIEFIRSHFNTHEFIPLHEPCFFGNEKEYLNECIDSTFVSSVGKFVDKFEEDVANFTGSKHAIATVNGTAALHVALLMAGVTEGDEVITQPLTFIATCNAISYIKAKPVFVDVDRNTMGLSAEKLKHFLKANAKMINGNCVNNKTKAIIRAVVPMHTFGLPLEIEALKTVCEAFNITIVEDAAESLGSYVNKQHTGTFGLLGVLSFNGNKTITTGGGGMILTNDSTIAKKAKHITTTAKIPHQWEFKHDQIAYNYRMPNINAAMGCAQLENIKKVLETKRKLAFKYDDFFKDKEEKFCIESKDTTANYWLNAICLENLEARNLFLEATNDSGVMTRPIWSLMNSLPMFNTMQCGNLENAEWLEQRIVNIPSSVRL